MLLWLFFDPSRGTFTFYSPSWIGIMFYAGIPDPEGEAPMVNDGNDFRSWIEAMVVRYGPCGRFVAWCSKADLK